MKHCELFKYIAFITFLGRTACDGTYVPHWENVECEVLEVKYPTYPPLPTITILGRTQIPFLRRDSHMAGLHSRMRTLRWLACQYWGCAGTELPHQIRGV